MKKIIVLIMSMLVSQFSVAATLTCEGKIEAVYSTNTELVYFKPDWSTNHLRICSLNATWKSVTAGACKSWLASMQSAMYLQKNVIVSYINSIYNSCSEQPAYSSAEGPYWVMFVK